MRSSRPAQPSYLSVYRVSAAVLLLVSFTISAKAADEYPELPRIHQVSERLYRGGQPLRGGIRRLAELGINTIVNLRGIGAHTRADESEARSLGLNYFNIPLPVWGRPNDADVRRVMEIISAAESGRVFIHCKDGVDRTGMIVALYRINSEGWSSQMATAEALQFGMRRSQYWMRDYISDFYARHQQAAINQEGHEGDIGEMKDKIGAGVRVGERMVFKARKTAVRAARRALENVF
ncbi:MAG TPA: sulfur transferase domain-containing protein, partial [Pyrinomonadaceae bacterium]|nr:sulfur transferase domain-containing protein [Pyrinomonadaceae bacterium]